LTVVPHLLEAGDVVEIPFSDKSGMVDKRPRRCKILSIEAPDVQFKRASEIEWLDTGERESKAWKAAKGINQPVWVVAGPKFNAALRREAELHRSGNGRWAWMGYKDTVRA
jgi:hypothetical protein